MATFTATHGVEFGEHAAPKKEGGDPGPYAVWAKFERDRTLDTADGVKGYTFSTDDAKVAERVRAVNDYGIAEVGAPAEAPAEPAEPAV
jgi:hypothetical protein